tara:strand:+ start:43 stop:882 length:840 start_codon:yes stop_codon:yes gene_type:complete
MPYKKKGQRTKMLELARKSRERAKARRAAKKKAATKKKPVAAKKKPTAQAPKFGARIPVGSRKSTTKAQTKKKSPTMGPEFYRQKSKSSRPKVTQPTVGTPPRNLRTPAQRAADKKKFLAEQQKLRKKSASMRHGSEYKYKTPVSRKDQEAAARAMEFGSGSGLVKAGVASGLAALGLKARQMHKAKKARDLASGKTGGTSDAIGRTRAASAAARTSGFGKAKPTKPKSKKGPSKFLSDILKRASGIGKPMSPQAKGWVTRRRNAANKSLRDKREAMRR